MAVDPKPSKMAVIREDVVERATLPHRHPRPVGVVVLFHRAGAARLLKVIAHVDGGGAAEGGLHPVAVAIIDEGGAGRAAHARWVILGVGRWDGASAYCMVEVLLRRALDHAAHRKHEERESLERPSRSYTFRGSAYHRDWTTPSLQFAVQRTAFRRNQWIQCIGDSICSALFVGESVGFHSVRPDLPGCCWL
jgi:hypothetical protein